MVLFDAEKGVVDAVLEAEDVLPPVVVAEGNDEEHGCQGCDFYKGSLMVRVCHLISNDLIIINIKEI